MDGRDTKCCRSLLVSTVLLGVLPGCVQTNGGALATVVAATVTGDFVRLMQVNQSVSNSAGRREHGNTADLLRSNYSVSLLLSQTPREQLCPTFAIGMDGSLFSIKNLNPLTP